MGTTVLRTTLLLALAGIVSACVTINIYFPAAAAEKAADKIIEEVWQLKKPQGQGQPPQKGAPDSAPPAQPQK